MSFLGYFYTRHIYYVVYFNGLFDETYPDYQTVSKQYQSLRRLVDNLTRVPIEDSLQNLAKMDESLRLALVDKWIAAEKSKKEEIVLK